MSIHFIPNLFLDDPTEHHNIANENVDIVKAMLKRLAEYKETMIPPNIGDDSEKGNPKYFNGTFAPGWCQSEPKTNDFWVDVEIDILS